MSGNRKIDAPDSPQKSADVGGDRARGVGAMGWAGEWIGMRGWVYAWVGYWAQSSTIVSHLHRVVEAVVIRRGTPESVTRDSPVDDVGRICVWRDQVELLDERVPNILRVKAAVHRR
jgi:hypothetical protein